jgi:quercetin dioxygenase-like cupin family protein
MAGEAGANREVITGARDGSRRFNVMGIDIELLLGRVQTNGSIEVAEMVVPPLQSVPEHSHKETDETLYVLEGELTILTKNGSIPAPSGTFASISRGVVHGFKNNSDAPVRALLTWNPQLGPGAETVFFTAEALGPAANDPSEIGNVIRVLTTMDMIIELPPDG